MSARAASQWGCGRAHWAVSRLLSPGELLTLGYRLSATVP